MTSTILAFPAWIATVLMVVVEGRSLASEISRELAPAPKSPLCADAPLVGRCCLSILWLRCSKNTQTDNYLETMTWYTHCWCQTGGSYNDGERYIRHACYLKKSYGSKHTHTHIELSSGSVCLHPPANICCPKPLIQSRLAEMGVSGCLELF